MVLCMHARLRAHTCTVMYMSTGRFLHSPGHDCICKSVRSGQYCMVDTIAMIWHRFCTVTLAGLGQGTVYWPVYDLSLLDVLPWPRQGYRRSKRFHCTIQGWQYNRSKLRPWLANSPGKSTGILNCSNRTINKHIRRIKWYKKNKY